MNARLWLMLGAFLALSPGASAAGGLDIAWRTCAFDGGATDVTINCSQTVMYDLVGTFVSDVSVPGLVRFDFVVDLQVDAPELPPFWYFAATVSPQLSACNWIQKTPGACASTIELWPPAPHGGFLDLQSIGQVGGVPNRGRIIGSYSPQPSPATVSPGVSYWGFRLSFTSAEAAEPYGQCPEGCSTPVTFVFNQATLHSNQGPPVVITGPGLVSNCATANGGNVPCGATPAKRSTWGTIKALYR